MPERKPQPERWSPPGSGRPAAKVGEMIARYRRVSSDSTARAPAVVEAEVAVMMARQRASAQQLELERLQASLRADPLTYRRLLREQSPHLTSTQFEASWQAAFGLLGLDRAGHHEVQQESRSVVLSGPTVDRDRTEVIAEIALALLRIREGTHALGTRKCSYVRIDAELEEYASYVQFQSRSDEPFLFWVCGSGTTSAQRLSLSALGFADGDAGKHAKRVVLGVGDEGAATDIALATLQIFEQVMDWSPRMPMMLSVLHDEP